MERCGSELDLPGFRFHPTEEELLGFYLRRAVTGMKLNFDIIGTVNLYRYDPWDLPALAKMGEREWYFFVPRDRRHGNGGRPNRTTERGFWKATGSDRPIRSAADPRRLIGLKKTLVYYCGRAPRGTKTEWVMNEYRLPSAANSKGVTLQPQEDIVVCRVYRKATTQKELEQRAAMEEDGRAASMASTSTGYDSFNKHTYEEVATTEVKAGVEVPREATEVSSSPPETSFTPVALLDSSAFRPTPIQKLPEAAEARQPQKLAAIQVPGHANFDWTQDPFNNQLRSPWMEQWSPLYAQLLNL